MMIAPNFQVVSNTTFDSEIKSAHSNFLNAPIRSYLSGGGLSANIYTDAFIADGNSTISILNTQGAAPVQYLYLSQTSSITSSVAVTPNGSSILVGTSNNKGLNIINTTTLQTMKIIPTPATTDESNITISPNGYYAYVSGSDSYNISVVSLLTYTVVKVLNVSYDPGKMVISPNGTIAFSFSKQGPNGITSTSLTEINIVNNTIIRNVTDNFLNNPDAGAISPNGSLLLVGNTGNKTITAINISDGTFKNIDQVPTCVETNSIAFNLQGTEFYFIGKNPTPPPSSYGGATAEIYSSVTFHYGWSINLTKTDSSSVNGMILIPSSNTLFVSVRNPDIIVEVAIKGSIGSPCLENMGNLTNPLTPGQITFFPTSFSRTFMVSETGLPYKSKWNIDFGGIDFSSNKTYANVTSYYGSQQYILSAPNYYLFRNSSGYLNVNFTSSINFEAYYTLNPNESRYYAILTENSTGDGSPIINTLNNTYLASLPTGQFSCSEAITPNGTLLLSLDRYTIPSLRIININNLQQIANISLPAEKCPHFVSINPDGLYAYVGGDSYNMSVISLETLSIVRVLNVSFDPTHMAFLPNGTEGFTTSGNTYKGIGIPRNFTVINTESNNVIKNITNHNLNCSFDNVVSPNGTYLAILNCQNVSIFNTKTLNIVKSVVIKKYDFCDAKFSPNGSKLYVTSAYAGNVNFSEIWMSNFTLHTIFSSNIVGEHFAFNANASEVYFAGSTSMAVAYYLNNFSRVIEIQSYSNSYSHILIPASSYYGSINFVENGLSANTPWSLTLNGLKYNSTGSKITAYSFTGMQNYSINIPAGYMLSERSSGQIMVSYENTTINLSFNSPISFKETGLGSNPIWYLGIKGYNTSNKITSGLYNTYLPFGTYEAIATSPNAQTYYLNFTFNTTDQTVTIPFKAQYNFSISQSGLPNIVWYLNITNKTGMVSQISGIGFTLTAALINGSYNYTVSSSNKIYKPSVPYGNFTINGKSSAVREIFSQVIFNMTFTESGLPSGTAWSVTLNGTMKVSTTSTISYMETNGSYEYTIGSISGYTISKSSGTATVSGSNTTVPITFTAVKVTSKYTVTFTESGLPSGTAWYVNLSNGMKSGAITTSTYSFSVTNGSVSYTISGTSGYSANKTSGSITVNGSNISISVKFTKPSSPQTTSTTAIEEYSIIGAVVAVALIGAFIWKRRSP